MSRSSKDGEPGLMQEIGPVKYKKMVEDNSRSYDKYKAGKRDPKTGEFYHHIGFDKPKKTSCGQDLGYIDCPHCDNYFNVKTSTVGIICSKCGKFVSFEYNKETKEMRIKE